jgi:hypothetical protein
VMLNSLYHIFSRHSAISCARDAGHSLHSIACYLNFSYQ